ncbi:MAG: hypothetical protein E6J45_03340 [Chloroflexi bacterium]|nr:MAG: hypothetical protein E6J45_03340 [Chloroflexota bacterium]
MKPQSARARRPLIGALAIATAAGAAGALIETATVHAYPPPGYAGVLSAGCATAAQGQQCPVTFTLTQPNGQPGAGVAVQFSVASCGSVSPTSGTTAGQGQATTTFTAGRSCCGTATLTATAPSVGVTAQTQVTISCRGQLLPATGSVAGGGGLPVAALATLIAAATVLLGGSAALALGRRRRTG